MTKQQIIDALVYHEVPESTEDLVPHSWLKTLSRAFNFAFTRKTPTIQLSYECSYLYSEGEPYEMEFYIHNKITGRNIYTQIATGDEVYRSSHEELADKLLELDSFASKLKIYVVSD